MQYSGATSKMTMIVVCFQGKPFNITVIQVYAPTTDAEEADQLYEDLKDLIELIPKKKTKKQKTCSIHHWGWNAKVGR